VVKPKEDYEKKQGGDVKNKKGPVPEQFKKEHPRKQKKSRRREKKGELHGWGKNKPVKVLPV